MIFMQKQLGIAPQFTNEEDVLSYTDNKKEILLFKQIIERMQKGNLPYINEEGIVEFP